MGKKKSLTEVQRAQIVILHKEEVSERRIAARLNVSKTGVHQALPNMSLKEYSMTENAVVDLEKPASVTITSFEGWQFAVQQVLQRNF